MNSVETIPNAVSLSEMDSNKGDVYIVNRAYCAYLSLNDSTALTDDRTVTALSGDRSIVSDQDVFCWKYEPLQNGRCKLNNTGRSSRGTLYYQPDHSDYNGLLYGHDGPANAFDGDRMIFTLEPAVCGKVFALRTNDNRYVVAGGPATGLAGSGIHVVFSTAIAPVDASYQWYFATA